MTAAAAAVLALGLAAPAKATIFERFSDSGTFEHVLTDCGRTLDVTTTFEVVGRLREGKRDAAGFFFLSQRVRFVDTFTDRATGRSFTVEGRFTEREQQAERLAGSVLRLTLKQSGASATVRDAAGRVVARDRGTITATVVFDTGGDDVPGGQVLSFTDDRISGPHPFLEDQCAVIDRALA